MQDVSKAFPEYFCPKVKTIESLIKEITQITNIINCPKIYLILEKSKASAELIELALRLRKYFLIVWIPETGKNLSGFPHNKANYQEVVKFQLQQL
ncbi:hypothetical protein CYANOKiyG1_78220 [Okeania sp. KiyG1]|nr:hypothetical protein CYANOKiyG1_78220 [Okeania sp. KiyG1]